jgi:hypothetical protein
LVRAPRISGRENIRKLSRKKPLEGAAVAAAKADALESAAIVALTAGLDKPTAVLPSTEMNRRLPASTVICPVRWDHVAGNGGTISCLRLEVSGRSSNTATQTC